MTYTIENYTNYSIELKDFLEEESPNISKLFGDKFDFNNMDDFILFTKGYFLVCKRDGVITGLHVSSLVYNVFDKNTTILQQQLFYVKPNSGRSAYYLFKKFIDIGKIEANHIITMLTSQTNIKPETLKSWGFEELETAYRMET